jgi:hypothetical protein
VQIDEDSVPRLPELAVRHLGAEDATVFLATVARSVLLRVAGTADPAGTGSRLGGLPLMPARSGWPTIGPDTWFDPRPDDGTPLRFLGQVNTSEVNPLLADPMLPPDTVLGFFFEASPGYAPLHWTDPWEVAAHRVVAVRVDDAGPAGPPGDAASAAHTLQPEAVTTVPPVEYFRLGLWRGDDWRAAARRRSGLEALYAELRTVAVEHPVRMFGWLDGHPRGWSWAGAASDDPLRLLLQVAVDPALGLGWPRTRSLYVFIGTGSLSAGPPYRGSGRYA